VVLPASLPAPEPAMRRRGRKFMGEKERQEVSRRMRKYWAARRANQGSAEAPRGRAMAAAD